MLMHTTLHMIKNTSLRLIGLSGWLTLPAVHAQAASAPTVTTIDPTNITTSSARLQAQVRANGAFTVYTFQWGTSPGTLTSFRTLALDPSFDSVAFTDVA